MQKNYVNATLMLRLSLDRCQEIQSYGSHSNHNLATPSPTSTTSWNILVSNCTTGTRVWGSCERQKLCTGPLGAAADGVDASPVSRGESTASGSTGTERLLVYIPQWLYPGVAGVNWEPISPTSAVYPSAHLTQHKPAVLCSYKNDPYSLC